MHSTSFFYTIAKADGKTGNSSCNSAYWREIITWKIIVFEIYPSSRSFIIRYKFFFLKIHLKNLRKEMLKIICATKNVAIHFLSHTCEYLHLVPHGIAPADITVLVFKHLHILKHFSIVSTLNMLVNRLIINYNDSVSVKKKEKIFFNNYSLVKKA